MQEAALRYNTKTPRYLHIASPETNLWGHQRSYRLQVFSFTGDHLPESQAEEKSMSWARWDWAVRKTHIPTATVSEIVTCSMLWNEGHIFMNVENKSQCLSWSMAGSHNDRTKSRSPVDREVLEPDCMFVFVCFYSSQYCGEMKTHTFFLYAV